jgi:DNA polymerase III subunit beta
MHVVIPARPLAQAIQALTPVTPSKPQLVILSHVRLTAAGDSLELAGTDLEAYVTIKLPANVQQPGATCVSLKSLQQALKSKKGDVTLCSESDVSLSVSAGLAQAVLPTLPGDEFPNPPASSTLPVSTLPAFPSPHDRGARPDSSPSLSRSLTRRVSIPS